ncbi:MAG: hypothetical protein Q9226_007184 [Calogaya cf. arnoldii]
MYTFTLQASVFILLLRAASIVAQGVNHANIHRGWHKGQGPYFCGSDADGDGPELLAAVLGPKCGATIWVKNTGIFGTSVNNGIGKCITAKLVDQEGGGAVDLNPAAWKALTDSPDGQVSVEWGYGSCSGGGSSTSASDTSSTLSSSDGHSQFSSGEGSSSGDSSKTNTGDSSNTSSGDSSSDSSNTSSGDSSNGDSSDSSKDTSSSNPSNDKPSSSDSSSGGGCTVQANDQCGGKDFTGCTTCADGMQCTSFNESSALPHLVARQSIDFDLVHPTLDPTRLPEARSNFNRDAAIASVVAPINADPLPQSKRSLESRDVAVSTYPGYTANVQLANAAMSAPLDCNKRDTYLGAKLFTNMAFDTALCTRAILTKVNTGEQNAPRTGIPAELMLCHKAQCTTKPGTPNTQPTPAKHEERTATQCNTATSPPTPQTPAHAQNPHQCHKW